MLAWQPQARYLAVGNQDATVLFVVVESGDTLQMWGFPTKVRSLAWSSDGRWLATGGGDAAIVWPFDGKDGPMGKAPLLRAERKGSVATRVAFHPRDDVLAVGFGDGTVTLTRIADEEIMFVDEGGASIAALAWNEAIKEFIKQGNFD